MICLRFILCSLWPWYRSIYVRSFSSLTNFALPLFRLKARFVTEILSWETDCLRFVYDIDWFYLWYACLKLLKLILWFFVDSLTSWLLISIWFGVFLLKSRRFHEELVRKILWFLCTVEGSFYSAVTSSDFFDRLVITESSWRFRGERPICSSRKTFLLAAFRKLLMLLLIGATFLKS